MGIDYSTQAEVQKQAATFRRKHGAMDWDAKVDDLIERNGYETGTYHKNSPGVLGKLLSGVAKKILALVSIQHRLILLSTELPQPKKPFAKGHELGHTVLPWHKEILFACDEHDLSPSARAQLEFEANEFSSEINFPSELLAKVYEQYPISMETVLLIKGWSGASIESAANAYAKKHPKKCVLLVLEEKTKSDGSKVLLLQRKVVSRPATKDPMSTLVKQQEFKSDHVLFTQSRTANEVKQAGLVLSSSGKRLRISLFNNTYKVLALAFEA